MPYKWIDGEIPAEEILRIVQAGSCRRNIGAQAFFLGQIRADECDGRRVGSIEYSSYREMADSVFERIISEAQERFELELIELLHSDGKVPVGTWSLLVWVASKHRQASFDALKWIVDAVKSEVPIFAKELFEDGGFQWKKNN